MDPFYRDESVTIWNCDIREVEGPDGPLGEVHAVVSSPPYNVRMPYDVADDWLPWNVYRDLAASTAWIVGDVLVPGGRVWWNTAVSVPEGYEKGQPKRRVNLPKLWLDEFESEGLVWVDQVAWTSQRGAGTAWGSFRMPSSPNLRGDYEVVQVLCQGDWERPVPAGFEGWRDELPGWESLCTTVWPIAPASRNGHPAPFTTELPARCIRLSTWPGEVVFDPFMGTGSTIRAALDLGRRAVGVELSEAYCEQAALRCAARGFGI